jgi:arylsulfatase A-like enzyme
VTRQYPHLHGLWGNGVSLPPTAALFSRSLADSGYACGMIGKMHLAACFDGRTETRLDDGYDFYR